MTDITVTQADREAAEGLWGILGPWRMGTLEEVAGYVARHRIEAQLPLLEALMLACMAGANLLAELDASDAEFEPEDQAVIEGAREDLTTARAALGEQK